MDGGSSLTMSVQPNVITSNPGGGRFDFDDGGLYCGGWQDGKAHGFGVCTGPKNVGEYSGSYNFGFEMSGVYKWANGAVYEGRWQNGKRHGVGVEYNGKWIYKGEWSQGFKGRYGVKASSNSAVKYEGTWANGLQDGYGSETYSDGGYYQGQMFRGLRHGYGVRKSAPYGDSQLNNPNKNGQFPSSATTATGTSGQNSMLIHSNSLQSTSSVDLEDDSPKPEDGFKPNIDRALASKNGFVLVAKPLDVPVSSKYNNGDSSVGGKLGIGGHRRGSLTSPKFSTSRIPGSNSTASILKGLRLRKQKSTSDLDALPGGSRLDKSGLSSRSGHHYHNSSSSGAHDDILHSIPFTLSPEELDITDPTTVETYTGEWKQDKRNGHGVCDRSDGLKYEGQWHNDMKCGYGVTTMKNGTIEEGKYKNNILIVDSKVKRFFQLGSSNIRQKIDDAVKLAQQAQTMALKKAEIADNRAATARDKADQATTAAIEADRDSQIAYGMARLYSDPQHNPAGAMGGPQFDGQGSLMMNSIGGFQDFRRNVMSFPGNPLQQRRVSQTSRYDGGVGLPYQSPDPNQMNIDMRDQQQQQQQHMKQGSQMQTSDQQRQQQQYLGPEPFNGRRGSFRGGSGSGLNQLMGGGGNQPSNQRQANVNFSNTSQPNNPATSSLNFSQMGNRQSSDPFNDLFDHYKPVNSANQFGPTGGYTGRSSRRMMPTRQTSLDYNQMRPSSQASQRYGDGSPNQKGYGGQNGALDRMRRFRMSSMDHAEENNRQQSVSPQDPMMGIAVQQRQQDRSATPDPNESSEQQQQQRHNLAHLVTKGEELQQVVGTNQPNAQANRQQQAATADGQSAATNQEQTTIRGTTPTGSTSYIMPSTNSANSSMLGNQTPTPSPDTQGNSYNRSSQQQYQMNGMRQENDQQYHRPAPYAPVMNYATSNLMQQRDVHSLADEQLYISAGRRAQQAAGWPVDRTEFSNYDFTINSGPRMAQRCIRRTASLSRHNPSGRNIEPFSVLQGSKASFISNNPTGRPTTATTITPLDNRLRRSQTPIMHHNTDSLSISNQGLNAALVNQRNQQMSPMDSLDPNLAGSQLTLESASGGSSGLLLRKPSLQVRYDPISLGGLMSREEVAALSHAQREQKRIESELAERRAKRPFLHLYLSIREFISNQRLLLTVLVINMCLFKMFADLVT